MPFNGSGVFQRIRNWVADAAAGIKVRADYHDSEDDGFAEGLTNCITKDGQTVITQNIPFNSKRATGLQDPVNPQDAATKAYTDTKVAAGGKLTGDMEIEKDHPQLVLDDTDASGAEVVFQHMGKTRWIVRMNVDAETGTDNAGSNFDILRYADDGTTLLGTPMGINRANGRVAVGSELFVSSGVIRLIDETHYLWWNGTQYSMPGGKLVLGAGGESGADAVTWDQLATKQANLGFTPVQQGGGSGMVTNKIYIGWDNSKLLAQVDGVPLGAFAFGSSIIQNIRWLHAGASYPPGTASMVWQDPFPGSVIYLYTVSGGTVIAGFQHKYLQAFTTSWFTIGF